MIRGAFGNPFAWPTRSGRPLAADLSAVTVETLAQKGFRPSGLATSPTESGEQVLSELRNSEAERLILLTLNAWSSDAFRKVTLDSDLTLAIYDRAGQKLAERKIAGQEYQKSASTSNPFYVSVREAPRAFGLKLEEMFDDQEMVRALN